jgi:hypothetical protein
VKRRGLDTHFAKRIDLLNGRDYSHVARLVAVTQPWGGELSQ